MKKAHKLYKIARDIDKENINPEIKKSVKDGLNDLMDRAYDEAVSLARGRKGALNADFKAFLSGITEDSRVILSFMGTEDISNNLSSSMRNILLSFSSKTKKDPSDLKKTRSGDIEENLTGSTIETTPSKCYRWNRFQLKYNE